MPYSKADLERRLQLSRELLSAYERPEITAEWQNLRLGGPGRHLAIPFPAGLAPTPRHVPPANPSDPFPRADVVVLTYTADEAKAIADVLTPSRFSADWSQYTRAFDRYLPLVRPGAPAFRSRRLASYWQTRIDDKEVLVVQSELHMHQDTIAVQGRPTLPVLGLFEQLLAEARPSFVFCVGAACGVYPDRALGTVVATRSAKFHCQHVFRDESFAQTQYRSEWTLPLALLPTAVTLMRPHAPAPPAILTDGHDGIPEFHPVLTADFFEFGTDDNRLADLGVAVDSADAVFGLAASRAASPPRWASVRGYSDRALDAPLRPRDREASASRSHLQNAYGAAVLAGIAAWGIIAGL